MTLELFISILVISATATSIGIEIIKTILSNFYVVCEYNSVILSTVIAFIVGIAEIYIYYAASGLSINIITFIYAVCMGISNAVCSQVGYDKTKEFLLALFKTE